MLFFANQNTGFLWFRRSERGSLHNGHAFWLLMVLGGFGALIAPASNVYAQNSKISEPNDGLNLNASYSVMHDSNLFRLSSMANTEAVLGEAVKSDDVSVAKADVRFDKYFSLQHVVAGFSLVDSKYKRFNYLNNLAVNYDIDWQWSLTPRFRGSFSARQNEALNSFVDYENYGVRSMRTDKDWRAGFDYELDGAWHLLANIGRVTRLNSETFVQEGDNVIEGGSIGMRRVFASGSNISYLYKQGRGDYFNREIDLAGLYPSQFSDREHELRLFWPVTGKTSLNGRLAYVRRNHVGSSIRDYSGSAGRLDLQWKVTAKSSVALSIDRNINGFQAVDSSYTITDRLALSPVWRITEKTTLRLQFDIAKRRYEGALVSSPLIPMREDTFRNMLVAMDWQPMRRVQLGIQFKTEERKSNRTGQDFDSNMTSVSAQWAF